MTELRRMKQEEIFSILEEGWVDFRMLDLRGTDFSENILKNVDFSGSNLNGVNFKGAVLEGCLFAECKMTDTNFENSYINNTDFLASEIVGAKFQGSSIKGSKFITQLCHVDFTGANLEDVNLFDATLIGVNFSKSLLKDVKFEWIEKFVDVNFTNAALKENVSFLGTVLNKVIGIEAFTVYFTEIPVSYVPEVDKVFFALTRKICPLEDFLIFAESRKGKNKKELKAVYKYFKSMRKIYVKNNK